jgi:alkylation response protein AidB-like acyl-CoA dehydrogenase
MDLLAWIATGAAERERRDESPFAQVAAVAEGGLGALSLPVDEGGQGAGIRELFAFVIDLAEADPIVAHVLRTITLHNPAAYKAAAVGRHLVNAIRYRSTATSDSGAAWPP